MTAGKYMEVLKSTPLFIGFASEELLRLFNEYNCTFKQYEKNSIIYLQNQRCSTLDVIIEGEILVQKIDRNGNILTISKFVRGDILGGNLLFAQSNSFPMTMVAKSLCTVAHIKKEMILELCQKNKDFLIKFMQLVSDKTLLLTEKLKSLTMKTLRQSIIEFLTYEYNYQKSPEIKLGMSKKELAERMGVQRPSLSRELNKMRKDGLVEYDAHTITIKDKSIVKSDSLGE